MRAAVSKRRAKDAPAPVASKTALHAVPLLGRDRELAEIRDLLNGKDVRLVTLTGPAGVGKTNLALSIAAQCSGLFEATSVVALAPISDPHFVTQAIAAELGLREQPDTPLAQAVAAHIGTQRRLLVLDNFEHLMAAASTTHYLLSACPNLTALVTSRERLHLRMEYVYDVRPLAADAGLALFVERAQAVNFDFALSDANERVVAAIVERLEGLPLAIELAAPRLMLLPPSALLARLERRLPLLEQGPVDLPERHKTMRDAIEWSYDLLSEHEQRVFRALSLFNAGSTIAAAGAVTNESADSLLALLAALIEKSLLSLAEDPEGQPRTRMLELLREFARERLAEAGEEDVLFTRMAAYYLEFATESYEQLKGNDQARWLALTELEHPNIRAVLDWALRAGRTDLGLRLAGMMWRFWWMRGYFSEGNRWYERFLERADRMPENVSAFGEAKALQGKAMLMGALGEFEQALPLCERAIALWREIGDEVELTVSLNSKGQLLLFLGRYDEARKVHEQALEIRRRIDDRFGIATSLASIGSVLSAQNDWANGLRVCEQSIDLFRALENNSGLAISLTKVGYILEQMGEYEQANDVFEECLALQTEMGDQAQIVYSYDRLASVAMKLGRYDVARARWRQTFDLLETVVNKALTADALEGMMRLSIREEDFRTAARLCGAAEALREAIRSPLWPYEIAEYDSQVRTIRDVLGDNVFSQERRFGAAAPLRQIIADAFAVLA